MSLADTLVIGAGVVGATTAYYLAREGIPTTVVDAASEVALDTSFANGGLVTPTTAFPWSSPGSLKLMLQSMGREDSPLLLRLTDIPRLGSWGLRFALNCRPSKYRQSAKALSTFATHSLQELTGLLAQRKVRYQVHEGGLLQIYRDEEGVRACRAYASFLQGMGVTYQLLDREAVVALEPSLLPISSSIRMGLLLPGDVWGDAREFALAVESACRELAVEFRYGVKVTGLRVEHGHISGVETDGGIIPAKQVVVCAGPATPSLLKQHGLNAPIQPVKGYSITLRKADIGFLPNRPIVDDHAHLGVTPLGDRLRVAGTVEFAGEDRTVSAARIANLTRALTGLFPGISIPEDVSAWAGLRPMTPDGLPIVDGTSIGGLYVNSGHGALGWTLACGSADLLRRMIMGQDSPVSSPFRMDRRYW